MLSQYPLQSQVLHSVTSVQTMLTIVDLALQVRVVTIVHVWMGLDSVVVSLVVPTFLLDPTVCFKILSGIMHP